MTTLLRLNQDSWSVFIFWVQLTLSLQYPLLFPRGEDEYLEDVQYNDVLDAPTIKKTNGNYQRVVCL